MGVPRKTPASRRSVAEASFANSGFVARTRFGVFGQLESRYASWTLRRGFVRHARRHPLAIAGTRLNPITHRRASDDTVVSRPSLCRPTSLATTGLRCALIELAPISKQT